MKHIFHNEVFSIRKLKVGTCSVLLAISILGSNSILADEIGTNTSQIDTKEISNVTTNDSSYSQNLNKNISTENIDTNSSTINLVTSSNVDSNVISDINRSNSQIDSKSVDNQDKTTTQIKSNKKDDISDNTNKKDIQKTALNVKDYGAIGDGVNDDRQAIQ